MKTKITRTPLTLDVSGYEWEQPKLRLITLSIGFSLICLSIFAIIFLNSVAEEFKLETVVVFLPTILVIFGLTVFVRAAVLNDRESTFSVEDFEAWSKNLYADHLDRIIVWVKYERGIIISLESAKILYSGNKVVFPDGSKVKLVKTENDGLHLFTIGK